MYKSTYYNYVLYLILSVQMLASSVGWCWQDIRRHVLVDTFVWRSVVDLCFFFTIRAGQELGVIGIEWQVESWYRVTADMEHTNTTVLSYIKCNFTCVMDTLLIHHIHL